MFFLGCQVVGRCASWVARLCVGASHGLPDCASGFHVAGLLHSVVFVFLTPVVPDLPDRFICVAGLCKIT